MNTDAFTAGCLAAVLLRNQEYGCAAQLDKNFVDSRDRRDYLLGMSEGMRRWSTARLETLIDEYRDAIQAGPITRADAACRAVEAEAARIDYENHGRLAALHTAYERRFCEPQLPERP